MNTNQRIQKKRIWEILRFIASGTFNTGLTYIVFILSIKILSPSLSYTVAYSVGIIIAYLLNTFFVFRSGHSKRMVAAVIASYLVQYFYGLAALNIMINFFLIPAFLAMPAVIIAAIPLQYLILQSAAAQALSAKIHEEMDND